MMNGAYQGKGYGYEAAHAFLDYLFREEGARLTDVALQEISCIIDNYKEVKKDAAY
ncbi:hypothetical protein [Sinanaerobacter sp. ZZT-01]|uniref:GNAT family N-acetyltransferase n=1 Tax=Sinanaerobacter sp. ZZT-01 TaxID=3111540 RepID=UPI002D77565F|nr:hypothetical protein [Sinanaerobacter sp. ZZT-01]WRR93780.1 hypothetical protein U5921_01250 [Sinanaerobacter sp. ZZT-01]